MATGTKPLTFKVAPHIVEDLGLNLYTTLPRVLVEFVANAYDADSPGVDITYDHDGIRQAREVLRQEYELDKAKAAGGGFVTPLETRVLPDNLSIVISDHGHGMSRDELDAKFLFAGRRRRREEPQARGRTKNGRAIMGRKGLGKLAGFGVAKLVEVTSKVAASTNATKVLLDYDDLIKKRNVNEIVVPDETVVGCAAVDPSGTYITLSRLLYDPLKSRATTIENEIAEYFSQIDPADFSIKINGVPVRPPRTTFAFAWPSPELSSTNMVEKVLPREGGGEIKFTYRMRFTGKGEALEAAKRGVRVYAHKRLAAAPSLLKADTNMHGFRTTDYLDGIVHADFVDEEETDYISTDRESLRWDSPLLSGLYDFLSDEIKEACKQYQKVRDEAAPKEVEEDVLTQQLLTKYDFSGKDRRLALRFAQILEGACKQGVGDPIYKNTLPKLFQGIGHGNILTAITELAAQAHPDLQQVVHEMVRLTQDEMEQFTGSVKARLKGIQALKKIIESPNFKDARNENEIQKLFEDCPWLVDATYTQFLVSADVSLITLFKRLSQELKVVPDAEPAEMDRKEPDLVFLLGNLTLRRVVIVELKASNVVLDGSHLSQLETYMARAEDWLAQQPGIGTFTVFGQLIGTKPSPQSRSAGSLLLRSRIQKAGADAKWKVRDFLEVLADTEAAHKELLTIQERMETR